MLSRFRNKLQGDANLTDLLKGSAITFVLKMLGMGLGYVLIYLISQKLGAEGVGFYNLMLQALTVLGMVLGLGMNMSVLRYVGQFDNDGERHKMHDLYRHFVSTVGPLAAFTSVVLYFGAAYIVSLLGKPDEYAQGLRLVAIVLPFFTINLISVEFIRGLRKLQISELVRSVLRPLVIATGILVFFREGITKIDVIYLLVLALVINSLVSRWAISSALGKVSRQARQFPRNELLRTSLPMMATGLSSSLLVAMPVFFLDYFQGQADVGVYSVAFRLAGLVSLVLVVVNTIAAPKFAKLYWSGRMDEVQRFVSQSTALMFLTSLFVSIVLVLWGKLWLGLFGQEFIKGNLILTALVLGQLVNAGTGSVGVFLNMSGKQKIVRTIMVTSTVIVALLMPIVVRHFEALGVACLIGANAMVTNIIMAVIVERSMGLKTYFNPIASINLVLKR